MRMQIGTLAVIAASLCVASPAIAADGAREQLTQASFGDRDRGTALKRVQGVLAGVRGEAGGEAALVRATALAYRAKLTGSRSDLADARKLYDTLVAAQPRNADVQLGLGAWHLSVVNKAGGLLGRVFGASRAKGEAALDQAVALGGDHAFYPGLSALLRLKADPTDARGRQLAEQAARAGTATPLDRILQRAANALLTPLRTGRKDQVKAIAQRWLPFGAFSKD